MREPFRSMDEALEGLLAWERLFLDRRDRRAVFLTMYGMMTRETKRRIDAGQWADNDWVARYLVTFADLYRRALVAYEDGNSSAVPKAWRLAFENAVAGRLLVAQDLLMGINAHVNHDLAIALDEVSIDPDRTIRKGDHDAVNTVLRDVADVVQQQISVMYAPGLAAVDASLGRLDEVTALFSLEVARENAWEAAVALANSRNGIERATVKRALDLRSALMARVLLAPAISPTLMSVLRKVEEGAWWKILEAARTAGIQG